jgi:hypothetical protein
MVTGEPMSDDQVVRLLEEIRDIQKENAANYKVALQNQQEAMAIQKRGYKGARQRLRAWLCCLSSWEAPTSCLSSPGFSMGRSGTKRRRFGVKPVHTERSVRTLSSTSTTMV